MNTLILVSVSFGLGLVVGWNFLNQPEWVKVSVDYVTLKLKEYAAIRRG